MGELKKMLIIDDDKAFSLVLSNHFSANYKVETAVTAKDGLELIEKFDPDILLLDYFLPETTGADVFLALQEKYPDIQVIILSANESSQTVVDLIKIGVRDYVVKDENAIEEVEKILMEEDNLI